MSTAVAALPEPVPAAPRAPLNDLTAALPPELATQRAFLTWRYGVPKPGKKPPKVPHYVDGGVRRGRLGAPEDLARLGTLADAESAAMLDGFDGVGIALAGCAGVVTLLDFDKCRADGVLLDNEAGRLAQRCIDAGCYWEPSPSGTGVHVIAAFASVGDFKRNDIGIEAFEFRGFVTLTGECPPELRGRPLQPLPGGVLAELRRVRDSNGTAPDGTPLGKRRPWGTREEIAARAARAAAGGPYTGTNGAGAAEALPPFVASLRAALAAFDPADRDTWIWVAAHCAAFPDWDASKEFITWATVPRDADSVEQQWAKLDEFGRGTRCDPFALFREAEAFGVPPELVAIPAELLGFEALPNEEGNEKGDAPGERASALCPPLGTISARHSATPPPEPPDIIEGLLPRDAGGFVGPGGYGKTTVMLALAVAVILGREFCGHEVRQGGRVLYITAEDSRETLEGRLWRVCEAQNLTETERAAVFERFHILDYTTTAVRLATAKDGATKAAKQLGETYAGEGLAVVFVDPTSLLGAGEESGNDGMAELLRTARLLSRQLACAVVLVHHTGQAVPRSETRDQYVGRGGTAFADNARFLLQLDRVKARTFKSDGAEWHAPAEVMDADINAGRVLAVFPHKHSYRERNPAPILLVRSGWRFAWHRAECNGDPEAARAQAEKRQAEVMDEIESYLRRELVGGLRHTRKAVEDGRAVIVPGAARDAVRAAVSRLLSLGRLTEVPLPSEGRAGGRQNYLRPRESATAGVGEG